MYLMKTTITNKQLYAEVLELKRICNDLNKRLSEQELMNDKSLLTDIKKIKYSIKLMDKKNISKNRDIDNKIRILDNNYHRVSQIIKSLESAVNRLMRIFKL